MCAYRRVRGHDLASRRRDSALCRRLRVSGQVFSEWRRYECGAVCARVSDCFHLYIFTASLLERPLYLSTGVISPSLNLCREKCSNARPNLINFVSTGRNIHCRVAYVPGAHDPSSTTLVSAAYIALVLNEHIALIVRKQFKLMSAPVFFFLYLHVVHAICTW
jgi:hypothetical protein